MAEKILLSSIDKGIAERYLYYYKQQMNMAQTKCWLSKWNISELKKLSELYSRTDRLCKEKGLDIHQQSDFLCRIRLNFLLHYEIQCAIITLTMVYIKREILMPTITHNKLVRDKILEIISSAGNQAVTRVLRDEEYLAELDRKLTEECAEYQADKSIEEMADVLEVLYAIAEVRGYSVEELERVRAEKAEKRGGFADRIFLEKVVEN